MVEGGVKKGAGRASAELEQKQHLRGQYPKGFTDAKRPESLCRRRNKRVLEGQVRNWNKNSTCADSTPKDLRTQSGRKAFAEGEIKGYWKGKCGTGIGGKR